MSIEDSPCIAVVFERFGLQYTAALRLYGPSAMSASDIVPVLPPNAVTETNRETLVWLKHDMTWISENELSAADSYRMFGYDEQGRPF